MAKQVHKPPAQSEKDRLGCIRGLISMFDFRQVHSPQKLLQDRRPTYSHAGTGYTRNKLDKGSNWERKPEVIFDVDKKKAGAVTTSIKLLMEEEMSVAHPGRKYVSPEGGRIKSGLEYGVNVDESHKRTSQNYKIAFDHRASDFRVSVDAKSCQNKCAYQFETPNISLNMPALMVEINHQCRENPMDPKNRIEPFSGCKGTDPRKDNLLVEFDAQLTDENCILQKAQCDVTEAFPNQKSLVTELLNSNRRIQCPKELMDSLELLDVNKELLLKLLEDQDPLLLKHVQEFQNIQAGKYSELELCGNMQGSDLLGEEDCCIRQYEELAGHKLIHMPNASFWRKDKSKGTRRLKGHDPSLALERIVVLKPNIASNQISSISFQPDNQSQSEYSWKHDAGLERVASHFSLKEIKRKLRYAISDRKKERLRISLDDVLYRIPHGTVKSGIIAKSGKVESVRRDLLSKTTSKREHTARTLAKRDKRDKLTEWASNMGSGTAWEVYGNKKPTAGGADPPDGESILYDETKNHLTIMLDTAGRNGKMCAKKAPKTLRRLLSWSEYNLLSPTFSPGRDEDHKSPQNMIPSPRRKFMQETTADHMSPLKQNIMSTQHMDAKQDDGIQVVNSHKKSESGEAIETVDIGCMEERDCLVACSETNSTEIRFPSERCNEEQLNSSLLVLDADEGRPQPLTSYISILPKSLCSQKLEVPEALIETPERPRPVSVLEAFFSGDIDSPGSSTTGNDTESSVHPGQTHFEESENSVVPLSGFNTNVGTSGVENDARFKYVQTLVQASGTSYDKLSKIWNLSDTLIDPFLFDEVAVSLSHLPEDPKLLFDCTNEVLVEVSHRCFKCTPWLYTIKPDIRPAPVGRNLIQEVCKGINRHSQWQFVYSLDQTIRKDMDCRAWMKLQCEIETTVFDMGDAILADLVEETVLYLWAQNHSSVTPDTAFTQ